MLLKSILRRCRNSSQGSNPSHVVHTSNLPMSRDRIDVVKVIEHPVGGGNVTISIPNTISLVGGYLLNTISIPVVETISFKIPYRFQKNQLQPGIHTSRQDS